MSDHITSFDTAFLLEPEEESGEPTMFIKERLPNCSDEPTVVLDDDSYLDKEVDDDFEEPAPDAEPETVAIEDDEVFATIPPDLEFTEEEAAVCEPTATRQTDSMLETNAALCKQAKVMNSIMGKQKEQLKLKDKRITQLLNQIAMMKLERHKSASSTPAPHKGAEKSLGPSDSEVTKALVGMADFGGAKLAEFVGDCYKKVQSIPNSNEGGSVVHRFVPPTPHGGAPLDYYRIPPVTILAPHKTRKMVTPGCKDKDGNPRICSHMTPQSLSLPVMLYTASGPELLFGVVYKCYERKRDAKGKSAQSAHARYAAFDHRLAAKNNYNLQLRNYEGSAHALFEMSLIEQVHTMYGRSKVTVGGIWKGLAATYGRNYLARVAPFIESKMKKSGVNHGMTISKFWGANPIYPTTLDEVPVCWLPPTSETLRKHLLLHMKRLERFQDQFVFSHNKGTVVLAGDHVFSMLEMLKGGKQPGQRRSNHCLYTLLNDEHYVVAIVQTQTESYAELEPLFQQIKAATGNSIKGFYVDKCCGRGSFGGLIKKMFPHCWVKLDLFHGVGRLHEITAQTCSVQKKFLKDVRNAHYLFADSVPAGTDHSLVPQSEKSVPEATTLLRQVEAVLKLEEYEGLVSKVKYQTWWRNYRPHIINGCLSDAEDFEAVKKDYLGDEYVVRGTVINECFHRQGKAATDMGVSVGNEMLSGIHRFRAVEWNFVMGKKMKNHYLPPISDLVFLVALRQASLSAWGDKCKLFYHPRLQDATEPKFLAKLFDNYEGPGRMRFKDIPTDQAEYLQQTETTLRNILGSALTIDVAPDGRHHKIEAIADPATPIPKKRNFDVKLCDNLAHALFCAVHQKYVKATAAEVDSFREYLMSILSDYRAFFDRYVDHTTGDYSLAEAFLSCDQTAEKAPKYFNAILVATATMLQLPVVVAHLNPDEKATAFLPDSIMTVQTRYPTANIVCLVLKAPFRLCFVQSQNFLVDIPSEEPEDSSSNIPDAGNETKRAREDEGNDDTRGRRFRQEIDVDATAETTSVTVTTQSRTPVAAQPAKKEVKRDYYSPFYHWLLVTAAEYNGHSRWRSVADDYVNRYKQNLGKTASFDAELEEMPLPKVDGIKDDGEISDKSVLTKRLKGYHQSAGNQGGLATLLELKQKKDCRIETGIKQRARRHQT